MLSLRYKGAKPKSRFSEERGNRARQPVVDLRRVVKTYESAAGKFIALAGIDFKLCAGEFRSIMGKLGIPAECGQGTTYPR